MADKTIKVREDSAPGDQIFKLTTFRNEDDPAGVVDITNYVFKLIVKRNFNDPDVEALFDDLTGSIVTALSGIFKFVLTGAHTVLVPATYPGEIRWWASAPGTEEPPLDAWAVDYIVEPKVRFNEP